MPARPNGLHFVARDSEVARALRGGAPDANGQAPERQVSDGDGNPCRPCLSDVAAGVPMLVLAHRPFPAPLPYAALGPIFLHAQAFDYYEELGTSPSRERVCTMVYISAVVRSIKTNVIVETSVHDIANL